MVVAVCEVGVFEFVVEFAGDIFKFLCLFACFGLGLYGLTVCGLLFVVFLSGVLLVCFVFVWVLTFGGCCLGCGGLGLLVCRPVGVGVIYSRRVLFWVAVVCVFRDLHGGFVLGLLTVVASLLV